MLCPEVTDVFDREPLNESVYIKNAIYELSSVFCCALVTRLIKGVQTQIILKMLFDAMSPILQQSTYMHIILISG